MYENTQNDEDISKFCFNDIAEVNNTNNSSYTKIYCNGLLNHKLFPNISEQYPISYCIGIQPDSRSENEFMLMLIITIRLKQFNNDIMIHFNIPSQYIQNISIQEMCQNEIVQNVIQSFNIVDFSIF